MTSSASFPSIDIIDALKSQPVHIFVDCWTLHTFSQNTIISIVAIFSITIFSIVAIFSIMVFEDFFSGIFGKGGKNDDGKKNDKDKDIELNRKRAADAKSKSTHRGNKRAKTDNTTLPDRPTQQFGYPKTNAQRKQEEKEKKNKESANHDE